MTKLLKRFTFVLFVLVAVFILVVASYFVFIGSGLDASSKAYVDANIPPIISSWSAQELSSRASPEFLHSVNAQQLDQIFAKFSKFGKLKRYSDSKGEATVHLVLGLPKITADYVVDGIFDNGHALIKVRLIQNNGKWEILSFNITTSAPSQHP